MTRKNFSLLKFGYLRLAVVTPELRIAEVDYNISEIISALEVLAGQGCQVALFPELCVTGYTCGDLFHQTLLLEKAHQALEVLAVASKKHGILTVVGLPLVVNGKLFNCAALIGGEGVLGIVPKTHLPNQNEYYERRWFSSSDNIREETVIINGQEIPVGTDLLFQASNMPECRIGVEICEDLWVTTPPSSDMALAGASVLFNLSASSEGVGKADYRRELVRQQSERCVAAYALACCGPNESSTDVVFSGQAMIAENGILLVESEPFKFSTQISIADIDLQTLVHERLKRKAYLEGAVGQRYRIIQFELAQPARMDLSQKLLRPISPTPFVPSNPAELAKQCQEAFTIQSVGLARRLKHTGASIVTLGISGGIDSTLALLVCIKAFEILGLDRQGIMAVSMPGPGTRPKTESRSQKMAEMLGVNLREIPIDEAIAQHFIDIGHKPDQYDTTYENAQARERTQILMDLANQIGGFSVGTGDLSELALGWCTFNADHMSMYHVNAGVPKTLARGIIEWYAGNQSNRELAAILMDVCAEPISPELLPLTIDQEQNQKTEEIIGPYILHDFFLYHTLKHACEPRKLFLLTCQAFEGTYSSTEILRWMKVFFTRFFSQQYKRSSMPDGPKVVSVALSPRGDWRMPSDASAALWLKVIVDLESELSASA